MHYDLADKRIWVAGHNGMVGSAVTRRLASEDCHILTVQRGDLDLLDQTAVRQWMRDNRPDCIVLAAAKVGGILANAAYPADFLHDNLVIETNIIGGAHQLDIERLLFLGSSCIYPKYAEQPISEDSLLTGPLEPTNEWYAIAKIAGVKLCAAYRRQYGRDYISAMPTNLFGPGDNFDLETSHVLPALLRKTHEAKQKNAAAVTIWGSGTPRREFLHVDDCADAVVFMLQHYSGEEQLNVGSGEEISVYELAKMIQGIVGFEGDIKLDQSKPDGTPRKLLSVETLRSLGWQSRIPLSEGISGTYQWFRENIAESPNA